MDKFCKISVSFVLKKFKLNFLKHSTNKDFEETQLRQVAVLTALAGNRFLPKTPIT